MSTETPTVPQATEFSRPEKPTSPMSKRPPIHKRLFDFLNHWVGGGSERVALDPNQKPPTTQNHHT